MEDSAYSYQLKKDVWSISEASKILAGFDPDLNTTLYDKEQKKIEKIGRLLKASQLAGNLKSSCVLFRGYNGNDFGYKPIDIINWAISKEMDIPQQLLDFAEKHKKSTTNANIENNQDSYTHTSELLEILHHAIRDNWENIDIPPTNDLIDAWFTANYPEKEIISTNIKSAMCTIMRPEKYK